MNEPDSRVAIDTLEHYLTNEYHVDQRDIREIEALLEQVATTFTRTFRDVTAWPYKQPSEKAPSLSHNTTAQILVALMRLRGFLTTRLASVEDKSGFHFPGVELDEDLKNTVDSQIRKAGKVLRRAVLSNRSLSTTSRTYGPNDVFTFAWLAELALADWTKLDQQRDWTNVKTYITAEAPKRLKASKQLQKLDSLLTPTEGVVLDHAFIGLRLVQAVRRTLGEAAGALRAEYRYFERRLHAQLSYSAIPDSRFDPAELVFCLEGMLLSQQNAVDRSLFDRVFEVLSVAQRANAHWRPVKPFLATEQGLVLFPVSIEAANSLLRCTVIFDRGRLHDAYGSKSIGLLRRYWQWLRARTVHLARRADSDIVGWHSEHVNESDVIHLWETSQVVEFLLAFRTALQSHIARTTLVHSRFTQKEKFKDRTWEQLAAKYEAVTSLGPDLQTYDRIGQSFVLPHLAGHRDTANYSMLLYGPAGTGKTTIAESIAEALHRRLLIITVSDFLAGGAAQIEARAKNIFAVLTAQPATVVLFDEIDHFLLDRDSDRYGGQETIFQFMTPGMLTKLNELRRERRAIFIIATNYEDRIDAAIKRTGRIDARFLVLPPDAKKRQDILAKLLADQAKTFDAGVWTKLQSASLFLGYKDLEAVTNIWRAEPKRKVATLQRLLKDRARTTSLEAYISRFACVTPRTAPLAEFLCLVALHRETGAEITPSEQAPIRAATELILKYQGGGALTEDSVQQFVPGIASSAAKAVAEALTAARS